MLTAVGKCMCIAWALVIAFLGCAATPTKKTNPDVSASASGNDTDATVKKDAVPKTAATSTGG